MEENVSVKQDGAYERETLETPVVGVKKVQKRLYMGGVTSEWTSKVNLMLTEEALVRTGRNARRKRQKVWCVGEDYGD